MPTQERGPGQAERQALTEQIERRERPSQLELEQGNPGTTFALDRLTHTVQIEGAPAVLQIGGFAIWQFVPGSVLSSGGATLSVEDLGLGEAYAGLAGPRVAGWPAMFRPTLSTGGSLQTLLPRWAFSPGQMSLTPNPVSPTTIDADTWDVTKAEFQDAGGETVPNAGPQVTLTTTNREGFLWSNSNLCWTFGDTALTPWQSMVPPEDQLTLNGIRAWEWGLRAGPRPGPDRTGRAWRARSSAFSMRRSPPSSTASTKRMAYGVFFQRVGLSASWDVNAASPIPSVIGPNGAISSGPQLNQSSAGALVKQFPWPEGAELASADMSGEIAIKTPSELLSKGDILMLRRTPLQMVLGSGFVNWCPPNGRFDFGGELSNWPVIVGSGPIGTVDASVSGFQETSRAPVPAGSRPPLVRLCMPSFS